MLFVKYVDVYFVISLYFFFKLIKVYGKFEIYVLFKCFLKLYNIKYY